MGKMQEVQPLLGRMAKGISSILGDNCEVVVHDLTRNYENTIVSIENAHVTGRKVGDGISEWILRTLKDNENPQDEYNLLSRTINGRVVKCSSIFIRDDDGKVIGLFSINYDITNLIMAQNTLESITSVKDQKPVEEMGMITNNVNELLDQLIEQADTFIGMPVAIMGKKEKTRAIQYLNDCGAFLITKAGDKVSKHYDISKYTLYNYLGVDD